VGALGGDRRSEGGSTRRQAGEGVVDPHGLRLMVAGGPVGEQAASPALAKDRHLEQGAQRLADRDPDGGRDLLHQHVRHLIVRHVGREQLLLGRLRHEPILRPA